jgi:cysteinyl-tRNA synthetase
VTEHLGSHVDIAAGGVDNLVRHHDYTLAIAESISGRKFADYWLHGAHLLVDGSKMSKSKGNVLYPDDFAAEGYRGEHVRFFLISQHYRRRLNFTTEKLAAAGKRLDNFRNMVMNLRKAESATPSGKAEKAADGILRGFEECMSEDLDVKGAFNRLFNLMSALDAVRRKGRLGAKDAASTLKALQRVDRVLKIIF